MSVDARLPALAAKFLALPVQDKLRMGAELVTRGDHEIARIVVQRALDEIDLALLFGKKGPVAHA